MELISNTFLQGRKYKIYRMLGQGGFGITYAGLHVALNRKVAIKEFFMKDFCTRAIDSSTVVTSTPSAESIIEEQKSKFLKEARTIAAFSNPHIIKIFDVFEENNTAYYVMEYITGDSIYDDIKKNGIYPEEQAIGIIRQVGEALGYVHQQKILHLDVKPANIMLRASNEAVLIDFGISKHYNERGKQTSITPPGISRGYAPMEQYNEGGVAVFSPATDIYSLGATLFYMLIGQRAPEALQVFEDGLPPFPEHISLATSNAISAAMRPTKRERPQSIEEFLSMLRAYNTSHDEKTIKEPPTDEEDTVPVAAIYHDKKISKDRAFIEQLISERHYKEAYNICIEHSENGIDVEYTQAKCNELIPLIKEASNKNELRQTVFAFIIATVAAIAFVIINILYFFT